MHQDNQEFNQAYADWIREEKVLSEKEFSVFIPSQAGTSVQFSVKSREKRLTLLRVGIAAALVLALFTTVAVKTQFFQEPWRKPHYTPEQIQETYRSTVKVLAYYSETISKEMDKLKGLDRFSQSFDQLKVFKNSVPSIGNNPNENPQSTINN